jgi:hypothetical protein
MDGDQLLLSIKGSFKNGAIANNRLVHSINGLNLSQSFNAVGCTVLSDEEKPASRAASMATGSRKAGGVDRAMLTLFMYSLAYISCYVMRVSQIFLNFDGI